MRYICRDGFFVKEKDILKRVFEQNNIDVEDFVRKPVVLSSRMLEIEIRPGMPTIIDMELKKFYIKNHLYVFLESKVNVEKMLGKFESETQMFDFYYELEQVFYYDVPINISYE